MDNLLTNHRLELTHKNHFKFGYNDSWFQLRCSASDRWVVKYGPCERESGDFRSECLHAAQIISSKTSRLPWIFMSGGIDSEIVALSFLAAKIKFKAVSIRFNDGLNRHDIQFAVDFTRKHKISHEIFDLNIVDFFASDEFLRLAHNSQCVTPQFPSLMKVMKIASLSNGYPVIGSGDCYLKKENNDWVLYEREKVASIYKFLIANRIQGCAGFFQYTPEIILAYLRDPIVEKLLQNQIPYKPSNYDLKSEIYSNYFEFESRPKFTGYEYLQNLDQKYRSTLKAKLPFCDEIFKTSHLSLAQQLSPRGSI